MKYTIQSLALAIFVVAFSSCAKQTYTADIDTSYYRIGDRQKSDTDLDDMIAPYKSQLDSQMKAVIAKNPTELLKERPNSALGNWFADILREEAQNSYGVQIDAAFQNYGGIRVPSLGAGDVTVGNIYELMPFDNELLVLEMDGNLFQMLLDRVADKGGWPVSGVTFTIDNDKAIKIMVGGAPLDKDAIYRVALPDYIANGGDDCFFLQDAKRLDKDLLLRDLIIQHLKNKPKGSQTINADATPRISTYKM